MIKIYDINDKLLMQAEVTSAAKREQEMSKSDYITLSFSAAEKVILPVGAYINYTYKIDKVREVTRKFLLLESYEPTQSDECSWKYIPQFQHPKMILSKTPFFIYTRNSQNVEVKQNVWSFVGTTYALSEKIKDFLNKDLMFGECGWKVIFSNVTANTVNVSFSDNDFISALTAITNAIGDNCEWHIDYDDEIIYIGKVLIGATSVVLEVGKNVGVPSINNSKEGYYNAFSIFGGTRNITQVNSKGENVSSGDIRLQLDEGNGTILIDEKERSYSIDKYSTLDLRVDKTKEPLFTKVLDFSQIFPSLNTYVYNVRGRVKYVLDEKNNKIPISNADGSIKEYKTFTVWYMRLAYPTTEKITGKTIINTTVDDGITHYWYDFEVTDDLRINGKNIGCSFEPNFNTGALSTPLAGQGTNGDYVGFELTYHKEASSSHTSDDVSASNFSILAGDYEIIYQEDNEVIIPTNAADMLIPRGESMPSLKCNITVLYNIAMSDSIYYKDAQNRLLEKAKEGIVRLLSDLNNYEVKSYSDVFLEDNPQLQIGQSVTYKDGHGYELATRVLKLSTNIDYDFIQSITIGNQVIKGTITQLKEDVQTIIASGGSSGNGGGYSVSQLRKLIAKYGSDNFISKLFDDIVNGTITFQKVQKFLQGLLVGNFNNENGGSWTPDAEGRSHLITDYLEVRMKAIFEELVINKTSTIGGKEIISPAGGVVAHKVEEVTVTYNDVSQKAYRCYFLAEQEGDAVDNDFAIGDQVRSESFNVRKGTYHKVGNHFYWRLVIGRDEEPVELEGKKYHYIDLSDTDCATASDVPAKGDVLNQCGNRTDVERQNCLIFSAVDTYSPSISLYHGINSYSFANREYVEYGVNKQNNKAFFHVYGDMYFGDRPTSANNYEGDSYVKFDSETKKVTIKGDLDIKSTYDGKTLDKYITEKSLDKNAVETIIKKSQTIIDLQNQIDGAIETWFYDGVPTLSNAPAIGWTTDNDKKTHLGDLYYDNKTGKAYRFAKDGSTYKWIIITDTELTKALKDSSQALKDAAAADKKANGAQATANTKRRIFGSQPVPPYDVNDMWVNATYPNDGSTYKNEILKCSTAKAEGEKFDIADWKLASKYTDDTKAEEAQKAAEKAQAEIKTTQSNLNALRTTVTENKKTFDSYVKDGYLEPSEIAAMAQDSKRLEDAFAAAEKSYNEVKGAEVLKSTKELTDLNTAFTTLSTAKTELIKFLSDISKRYNETDTNGKAAIVSAVGTKFTNFQSAYSAFYDKLGLANAYITSKIYGDLKQNITDLAGYKYIKDALGQTTDIDGGLVMTTLLALRDGDGNVQSGINGAIDPNRGKRSIATWWGGQMVDKDYNNGNLTPATSLIRFDGSGYLANGAIWWDVDGMVHADPTSFIINKNNVGVQLALFAPIWKSGTTDTTKLDNVLSIDPQKPFTHLDVSGNITTEGALKIGGVYLSWDSDNNALRLSKDAAGKEAANFYALGGITAYGKGAGTSGGGGLNGSVKSYADALKLTSESLSEVASAYSIKALSRRIDNIATELGGLNLSWNNITGKPSTFTPSAHTHKWTEITDRITKVSQLTNDKGYLTAHQSLASYYTKSSVDSLLSGKSATSHTHSVKINGVTKTIAATGGTAVDLGTYLTSHQTIYGLTIQKNGTSLGTYTPNSAAKTINVTVPTKLSELSNDSGYTKNTGTVTSVAISVPTGLSVSGSPITTNGTIAIALASGYSIPTTAKQTAWDGAVSAKHTHSNKSVLDGISSTKVSHWNSAYDWYALMTTDEETADGIINKWNEVVSFLANIAQTDTLSGIVDGINKSISDEVARAKKAEGVNASGISANKGSIATLQGYFTNGSAKKALQLTNARKLWGNSFNGTADINGSIIVPSGKYISIGNIKLEYDAANKALKITNTTTEEVANLYTSGGVSAYGAGTSSSSGGGGLNGSVKAYNDALKLTSESLSEVASAYSIKQLSTRITSLEGGSATSISVSGSGNAVTSVTKNGTTISVVKGSTFSLSGHTHKWADITDRPSSLKNPSALSWSGYSSGSYDGSAAKSISIPNNTNQLTNGAGFITASASITGNAATATKVNHSLSVFGKSFNGSADVTVADTDLIASISTATANLTDKTEILTSYASDNGFNDSNSKNRIYRRPASAIWGYINSKTISNADKLDNVHLNGIFTALSNTNNGVSMTIGTVAKSLANMQVYSATKLVTARNIALNGDLMGNANFDGSANITINGYMSYCNATVSNTNTYPWRRIAKVNELTGNYSDGCILLYISEGFNGGYYGIARVYIRTDNLSTGANASCSIQWISRNGYGLDSLKIAMYKTTGKAYYDVFLKMSGAYSSVVIRTLQDMRGGLVKRFTLVNSTEGTNAASHTEAYATIEDAATAIHNQAYTSIAQGSDVATVHNADMVDGIHASGLFTNLSNSGNSLSITVGGTNKTLTVNYASNAGNADTLDGVHASGLFTNLSNSGNNISITIGGTNKTLTAAYATNCDTVDGYHAQLGSSKPYGKIPVIGTDGVIELGHYIDFHHDNTTGSDYSVRLQTNGNHSNVVTLPTATGTLALTSGNVASATKLQTARTIWGQSFNGTANVSGALSGATTISASNTISTTLQNGALKIGNKLTPISAIDAQVIFNTGAAIRFGETAWDWNQWAGLKYTHSNKTVYLGIADGSVFNANKAQSYGKLQLKAIDRILFDSDSDNFQIYCDNSYDCLRIGSSDNSGYVLVSDIGNWDIDGEDEYGANNWRISIDGSSLFKKISCPSIYTADSITSTSNKALLLSGNVIREYHHGGSLYYSSITFKDTTLALSAYGNIGLTSTQGITIDGGNGRILMVATGGFDVTYRAASLSVSQTGASEYTWTFNNGSIKTTGGITAYQSSDERLKHDIHGVDSLAIIKAMGGTVSFRYNADNKDSIGWIAQRVLHNTFMQDLVEKDENGYLKINYWSPKLIAVAFGAIEQVDDEVVKLKARVRELENEVEQLKSDRL